MRFAFLSLYYCRIIVINIVVFFLSLRIWFLANFSLKKNSQTFMQLCHATVSDGCKEFDVTWCTANV